MSDDDYIKIPVRVTGDLEPDFVKAMNTAMDMCKEAGWTVETAIIHKMTNHGLAMWRLDARSGEDDA